MAKKIADLSASLAEATRRTDPDFVALGEDLKDLHTCAFELGRSIGDHAGSVTETLKHSRIGGDDGLAARSLAVLRHGMEDAARNLAALVDVADALGNLQSQGSSFCRVALLLKSSGCSFAVESARSSQCQQSFGAFVEELRGLAGKIAAIGEGISDQARDARSTLDDLTVVIRGNLEDLQKLTAQSETAVHKSTEQMQGLLDSSHMALQEAESRTRDITRHAGDAVFHLQFGDIVRQKLEHVVASLEDAARIAAGGGEASAAALVIDLQVAQIEAVRTEIAETKRQLSEAFGGLAGESGRLADGVRDLAGSGGSGDGGRNLFDRLKAELQRLEKLQRRGHDLCIQARNTSHRTLESAASLSKHIGKVQDINREMHLQALNAIIKTALLGDEGRTLEVLSTHVHSVFQESSGIVQETIRILEHVRSSSQSGDHGSDVAAENDGLEKGLAQIVKIHAGFQTVSAGALALVDQQKVRLDEAASHLEFLAGLSSRLDEFNAGIRAIRASMAINSPVVPADAEAVMSALFRRYTMESERVVHRRVLGLPEPAHSAQGGETGPPAGDNLDLFDSSDAEPGATGTEPRPKAPAMADNMEFF